MTNEQLFKAYFAKLLERDWREMTIRSGIDISKTPASISWIVRIAMSGYAAGQQDTQDAMITMFHKAVKTARLTGGCPVCNPNMTKGSS